MKKVLLGKIEELKKDLEAQAFSTDDTVEIEKRVEEYRNELIKAKKEEYEKHRVLIEAKIEVLEEMVNQVEEDETKSLDECNPTLTNPLL